MGNQRESRTRLAVRASLTLIFAVATVLAFSVGRPVVGVVMIVFLCVSAALLVQLVRYGQGSSQ